MTRPLTLAVHPPVKETFSPELPAIVNSFLPLMFNNINKMIFVKDSEFRIVFGNEAFFDMYPPERRSTIIGTTTCEEFPENEVDVFLAEDRKAFDTGYSELTEELTDYTGRVRTMQIQKIRFTDEKGNAYILGMGDDITKHVLHARELAQKNLALENFAAVAAHDLRSPLASVITALDYLLYDKNTLTKRSVEYIDMMKHSCRSLVDQIAGLLSVYKQKSGQKIERDLVDLRLIVEEVKQTLSAQILKNDAIILSNALPEMSVDRHMFRQLMCNLIENSIKYRTREKPVIIIRHKENALHHLFSIEDNGRGISPEHGKRVFDMFDQCEDGIDGAGIGMALCRKIVEWHGGAIWVDPKRHKGTRICFTISKSANS